MDSNNELKGIDIKNGTCYYFDGIIKTEELDLDNILIDTKSHENNEIFQFITFYTKLRLMLNLVVSGVMKQMDLLEFILELGI